MNPFWCNGHRAGRSGVAVVTLVAITPTVPSAHIAGQGQVTTLPDFDDLCHLIYTSLDLMMLFTYIK